MILFGSYRRRQQRRPPTTPTRAFPAAGCIEPVNYPDVFFSLTLHSTMMTVLIAGRYVMWTPPLGVYLEFRFDALCFFSARKIDDLIIRQPAIRNRDVEMG